MTKTVEEPTRTVHRPNLWLMKDLHRRIAAAARQFPEHTLLLRPTRRHVFLRMYQLPEDEHVPDFFKSCFGVLARDDDPDKKPCLVIETDDGPSEIMKRLYRENAILWAHIRQDPDGFRLECLHGGTEIRVEERTGNLLKMLAAPLAWYERRESFPQGSYVHSHSERVLRDAVKQLSPSYRIECHHQVPVSAVLGYKPDLAQEEKRLLGVEIDSVITQSFDADPEGAVILPIKLDVHDAHRADAKTMARDKAIDDLCHRYQVPLMVVRPDGNGGYTFECPALGLPDGAADDLSAESWAHATAPVLGAALEYAGRSF
jgi:hypothetical protein